MQKKTNKKGTGHIFKRGLTYYLQFSVNGKRITRSLKTKDQVVARKKAKEITSLIPEITNRELTVIKIAEAKNILSPNRINIVDIWDKYLECPSRPDSSTNTLKGYKSAVNLFIKWTKSTYSKNMVLTQVTDEVAGSFANFLWKKQKVSERTYNSYIKTLCLVFRVLTKDVRNPFAKENISRKHEKQQHHYKFTEKELKRVLEIFSNPGLKTLYKEEMEILFNIGAFTGLRLIDCCKLQWSNINFDTKIIRTIPVKTQRIKRYAVIPLVKQLEEKLKTARQWEINNYILPAIAERYSKNPDGIRKDTIKILKFTGLKTTESPEGLQRKKAICRYGFHSFRHTFASIMASKGYNINMLAKVMADDTSTLEKYYINIDDQTIKETFESLIPPSLPTTSSSRLKIKIQKKIENFSKEELEATCEFLERLEKKRNIESKTAKTYTLEQGVTKRILVS